MKQPLWKKAALGAGAFAAALTLLVGTAEAQPVPVIPVSAQQICTWKHLTDWRDKPGEGNSVTYGHVICNPIHGVVTRCQVWLQMDASSDFVSSRHRQGCNASAQLPNLRPLSVNYGARFTFHIKLINPVKRWTQLFVGSAKTNRKCKLSFTAKYQHVLRCSNEHEDGRYLPGPTLAGGWWQ